jgi:hypothetical protein
MLQINLNSKIIDEAPKPISIAFLLGASDAESSRPVFAPESYFIRRVDMIAYAFGYEAVRGANEATREFTKSVSWEGK